MSKVTMAFGSFVAGISSTLLFLMLSGNHTSILAQAPSGGPKGVVNAGAEPVIPPLRGNVFGKLSLGPGFTQPLDGLECGECELDVTLTYAGGAARIGHLSLSGTTRVSFTGAAANAIFMMNFLQSVMVGKPLPPPRQNDPILRAATAPNTVTVNFVTPYGQK